MQQRTRYSQSLSDRRFEIPGPHPSISPAQNSPGFCLNCPCQNCINIKNNMRQPRYPYPEYKINNTNITNGINGMSSNGMSSMEIQQHQRKNDYMLGYQTDYRTGNGTMTPIDFSSGQISRDKFNGDYFKRESFNSDHFSETIDLMGNNNHVRYERPETNTKHKLIPNNNMRMAGGKTVGVPAEMLN